MSIVDFGPFRLSYLNRCLFREGTPVVIGSRAFEILSYLVERPGTIISKRELMHAVWPDVAVGDANVSVQIASIRRILGKGGFVQNSISTEAGLGFRFDGPIAIVETNDKKPGPLDGDILQIIRSLPRISSRLVGRESEVKAIVDKLRLASLVTITGLGGIGKTRVAIEVGDRCRDCFGDGIFFVDLSTESHAESVLARIAAVLQINSFNTSALLQFAQRVADKHMLLIIDNCEHLIAAVADAIGGLLQYCPNLVILTTSREPLAIADEHVYPILPLPVPPESITLTAELLLSFPSVDLLVDRARSAGAEFEISDDILLSLAKICRSLDGIPLAIEIAAVRCQHLGIEGLILALESDSPFALVKDADPISRHHTLRSTLTWSHNMLSTDEQIVFRRLSIFVGGCALDQAEAILSDDRFLDTIVTECVASLVEKSLVVAQPTAFGMRYAMLETVRAYAREELVAAGEEIRFTKAHAHYYRDLFFDKYGYAAVPPDGDWLAEHEADLDNVRAALDWAFGSTGDPLVGIVLAPCAARLWKWADLEQEIVALQLKAAAFVDDDTPALDRARLWRTLARSTSGRVQTPRETEWRIGETIEIYRRFGEVGWLIFSLTEKALIDTGNAHFEQADAALHEARTLVTPGQTYLRYAILMTEALLSKRRGQNLEALQLLEEAIGLAQLLGCKLNEATAQGNLADLLLEIGRIEEAVVMAQAQVATVRQIRHRGGMGFALANLTACLWQQGNLQETHDMALQTLMEFHKTNSFFWGLEYLSLTLSAKGAPEVAVRITGYLDKAYLAWDMPRSVNESRARLQLMDDLSGRIAPQRIKELLAEGAAWNSVQLIRAVTAAAESVRTAPLQDMVDDTAGPYCDG